MSKLSLIIGEPGTGKSTSIETLDPNITFILNVIDKPLPFKGFSSKYKKISADKLTGNYFASDNSEQLNNAILYISNSRPDIKIIILDDWYYIMGNEYMRRTAEKGYEKFNQIGYKAWSIIETASKCRSDLYIYIMTHSEYHDGDDVIKCKTVGKLVDKQSGIEGKCTSIFHSRVIDDQYVFATQFDGTHMARTPKGMFDQKYIPNDLNAVHSAMCEYYDNN